jgi:CubicO group peptidase (beta-lactamase class C family)
MSYREFLKANILDPLKMKDSAYDPDGMDYSPKAMAVGYNDLLTDPPVTAPYLHPTVTFSAGAIYSTVKDLYLWDQALYTDQLVSQETLARIFTPGLANYGYGWYIDHLETNGYMHKHIWHWGSYIGYHSYISRLVDDGVTVILLLNTTAPDTENQDQLRPVVRGAVSIIFKND